jgi:hypothetical protein
VFCTTLIWVYFHNFEPLKLQGNETKFIWSFVLLKEEQLQKVRKPRKYANYVNGQREEIVKEKSIKRSLWNQAKEFQEGEIENLMTQNYIESHR